MHVVGGQSVEIGVAERALRDLWNKVAKAEEEHGGHPTVRAASLNLVVCSLFAPHETSAVPNLAYLIDHCPCRVLMLVPSSANDGSVRAAVSAHCRLGLLDGAHVCGEEINVSVPRERFEDAVSAVNALLIPDLPVCVWWRGDTSSDSMLFQKFLELSDRLIVDSAECSEPVDVVAQGARKPVISNLAWERITVWRQLTAQFFDAPDQRLFLDSIKDVEIDYGPRLHGWRGIAPEAILFAGWLASRLDWRFVSRELSDLQLAVHLMSSLGKPLRLTFQRASGDGIAGIRIHTGTPVATYSIGRMERAESLQATTELPQREPISRVVHSGDEKTEKLLLNLLRLVDRDMLYEQALATGHAIVNEKDG